LAQAIIQRGKRRSAFSRGGVEAKLREELERLKAKAGLDLDLKVVLEPDAECELSGRVEGKTIYIYECDEERALDALRHEFIDYIVSRAVEPYKEAANKMIQFVNEAAYKRKEEAVEALKKLLP